MEGQYWREEVTEVRGAGGGNGGAVLGGETTLPEQQYFEQNLR